MHCTHEGPQAEKMADTQPEKMGEKPEKDRKQAAQYIGTKPKRGSGNSEYPQLALRLYPNQSATQPTLPRRSPTLGVNGLLAPGVGDQAKDAMRLPTATGPADQAQNAGTAPKETPARQPHEPTKGVHSKQSRDLGQPCPQRAQLPNRGPPRGTQEWVRRKEKGRKSDKNGQS